jgi:hypothetical protein
VDESKPIEQSETNGMEHTETNSVIPPQPVVDDHYEAWLAQTVPQYQIDAYEGFLADLEELLAHREANPADRWVAYRGRQRLGFGTDQTPLYNECLAKFRDGKFGVYHIGKQPRSQQRRDDPMHDNPTHDAMDCSESPVIPSQDGVFQEEVFPPIPQHATEAAETYLAELDELLSRFTANPTERWVAYRGRQRLGFGSDQRSLYVACLERFPDHQFCVYGIDACAKHLEDTVV